jgi:hypothetical protein
MRRILIGALLLCSACIVKVGQRPEDFGPATTASGIRATLALSSSRVEGELLEVREESVVVMTQDRLLLIPINAITASTFANTPITIVSGQLPNGEDHRQLRLLSRYPQGIPLVALEKLLASKGQTAMVTVR